MFIGTGGSIEQGAGREKGGSERERFIRVRERRGSFKNYDIVSSPAEQRWTTAYNGSVFLTF